MSLSQAFEELDYRETVLGAVSLRRRIEPKLNGEIVYEVKLGEDFLMSSLFTEAEIQLAGLGLTRLRNVDADVVVGGLGLGYTAVAVLNEPTVKSLTVIELFEPVIDWHRRGLVPNGAILTSDPRCTLRQGNFFEIVASPTTGVLGHAVLVDIDHSPGHWLAPENSAFYSQAGLATMSDKLHPGGVLGMWSNDPPDRGFIALLDGVFDSVETHIVSFENLYTGGESSNSVYLAYKKSA